jgi:cysteine desulfurase
MHPVYLDHNATTPIDAQVLAEMLPFLQDDFGNPSSAHALGRRARDAIESARAEVASLISASTDEIVFTSGGTEASNIAIRGAAKCKPRRSAIVTTTIEHPATESCCALLEREGHKVARVAPRPDGTVEARDIIAAVDSATALVTIIHAQNEIGTIQPVSEIASAATAHGALIHADAAQSLGKIPVNVNALGVDLLTIAGHKLYAPKGIGALFIRRGVDLPPLLLGAGQESGRRPGTENVAGIVALGAACRIAGRLVEREKSRLTALGTNLLSRLQHEIPTLTLIGDRLNRLPNTLNVLFPGVSSRHLLENCPSVQASTGSACHADREEPSAILLALGISHDKALGAVRLSLGRSTTADEIDVAASSLAATWRSMTSAQIAKAV